MNFNIRIISKQFLINMIILINHILDILPSSASLSLLRFLGYFLSALFKMPFTESYYHRFRKHHKQNNVTLISENVSKDTTGEECAVLFSGGKDCTAAALFMAGNFKKVHLITIDIGKAKGSTNCLKMYKKLIKKYGADKFSHTFIDGRKLFEHLFYSKRTQAKSFFHETFRWSGCIHCYLVMEILASVFCEQKDLHHLATGWSPQSKHSFGQNPLGINMSRTYLDKKGITLHVPLWENFIDPKETLLSKGIISDKRIGKPYQYGFSKATQGFCPLGLWQTINLMVYEYQYNFKYYLKEAARFRIWLENEIKYYGHQNSVQDDS